MASKIKKQKKKKIKLNLSLSFIKKIKIKKIIKWLKKNYLYALIPAGSLLAIFLLSFLVQNYIIKKDEKEIKKYIIISYNKVLYKNKKIQNKAILDALDAYETGYMEKAKFLFQSALNTSLLPIEKKAALVNLANIFDDFTHYDLAVKYLKKAIQVDKRDGLIYHNLGIVYKHKNEYNNAVNSLLLAVKYNKKFIKSYLSLASLYFYKNNYSKALKYYIKAENINPSDSEIKYNTGICYFKLKQVDRGMKAMEGIIHSEYLPDKIKNEASKSLGNYFASKGNYKKSLFYFKKASEFKDEYDVHYRLGSLYNLQGEYEKAMKHFERAYKLNKKNDQTIRNLAELYMRFGEHEKALKHYKYLIRHYKEKTEILLLLGDIYLKKNDINEAANNYKKALEYSPTPDEAKIAYMNLGNLYFKLDNFTEAIEFYNKALEIDKTDINIYYNISLVYMENDDFENGLKNIDKGIKLNPNSMNLYLIKSKLLYSAGKTDRAIINFKKMIDTFPDEIVPYFELGSLYYKIKDLKNAEKYFNRALGLKADNNYQYKIFANLSAIYYEKKEYKKALEYINKAFILNSRDSLISYNCGLINSKMGQHHKAKEFFHQALRMPGDDDIKAQACLGLGNILFLEKKYTQAESMYKKAKEHDPDFTEAFYNLKVLKEKNSTGNY